MSNRPHHAPGTGTIVSPVGAAGATGGGGGGGGSSRRNGEDPEPLQAESASSASATARRMSWVTLPPPDRVRDPGSLQHDGGGGVTRAVAARALPRRERERVLD